MTDSRCFRFARLPAWLAGSIVFAVHAGTGIYLRWGRGVDIASDPILNNWDAFWQTLPIRLLKEAPVASLLHCHAQPPLLNVVGLVMHRLFGAGDHLAATYSLQMILGAFICAMAYALLRHLTGKPFRAPHPCWPESAPDLSAARESPAWLPDRPSPAFVGP